MLEFIYLPFYVTVDKSKDAIDDPGYCQALYTLLVFFVVVVDKDAGDDVIKEHVGYNSRDVAPMRQRCAFVVTVLVVDIVPGDRESAADHLPETRPEGVNQERVLFVLLEDEAVDQNDDHAVDKVEKEKAAVSDDKVDISLNGMVWSYLVARLGGEFEERVFEEVIDDGLDASLVETFDETFDFICGLGTK